MDQEKTAENNHKKGVKVPIWVLGAGLQAPLSYLTPNNGPLPQPGSLVKVPLKNQKKMGIVLETRRETDDNILNLKVITEVVRSEPLLLKSQMQLCRFVAEYYCCTLEDSLQAALPPMAPKKMIKTWSLTHNAANALVFHESFGLKEVHSKVLQTLKMQGGRADERALKRQGFPMRALYFLESKNLIEVEESQLKAQGRQINRVVFIPNGENLPKNKPALKRLDQFLQQQEHPILTSDIQKIVSNPKKQLDHLVALGRAKVTSEDKGPQISVPGFNENICVTLTDDQQKAFNALKPHLGEHQAFLLEGITGSGKTQVYLEAMHDVVAQGKSVLFIVPEIALTPQLLSRVQQAVGPSQAVLAWHSGVSPSQRRDNYYWLLGQEQSVIVGARSAVFAPITNLGLIIVDEEHDGSYKQDSAPRYHGRDLALFRAKNENATIILGSATPSLESLYNVRLEKLKHLQLLSRPGSKGALPKVEVIDLKARKEHSVSQFRDRATTEGHGLAILSGPLKEAINETLKKNQQTLLFLNRRGYASFVLCENCGHVAECENCSVSLTYHRFQDRLKCHQCGYQSPMLSACPECESSELIPLGLGTERIENEVRLHFPNASIARLDRDVIRKSEELKKLLTRMHRGEIDILIGTQMLAKGHDFPGVTLVGVILAETGLAFPDYRASERTFQLLTQVAGRAGRRNEIGRVLIQTFNPKHVAIERAAEHDVQGFVEQEMTIREKRHLPPFCHAALFRIEGKDLTAVETLSRRVGQTIREFSRETFEEGVFNVLGPAPAPLEKIKNKNRYHIWFWSRQRESRAKLLRSLQANSAMHAALKKADARLIIDVDPMHVL